MTERFVSAGTMFVASGGDGGGSEKNDDDKGKRDEGRDQQQLKGRRPEWEAVQQELEAERKMREEQRRKMVGGEEKSLYDILQANKGKEASTTHAHTQRKRDRETESFSLAPSSSPMSGLAWAATG